MTDTPKRERINNPYGYSPIVEGGPAMTITPEREREEWEPVAWRYRYKGTDWLVRLDKPTWLNDCDETREPLYGPDLLSSYKAQGEELERALAEISDLKSSVVAFAAPWADRYAREFMGLPSGHLHPEHFDLLERCGGRMDDFTRANIAQSKGDV